jgi:predicted aspartyl protease
LTKVPVKIRGPNVVREISLVVSTESEDTWIRSVLEEIGLEPRFTRTYRTINNARVRREVAPFEVECVGIEMPCPMVFADEQDANVLGATALEILGLEVDPRTYEIGATEALAAY